MVLSTI